MALRNPMGIIEEARRRGVAVPGFNIHNLEMLRGVIDGAEKLHAPVIVQITPTALAHGGLPYITACAKAAGELLDFPIALHLDHCGDVPLIMRCLRAGFTSVMIDAAELPYEENVATVRRVAEIAHDCGVAVEGEIGRIGGTEDELHVNDAEAYYTVPEEAQAYARETGIDMIAVAIGTAHGVYKGEPKLDFARLRAIASLVKVPIVLHGASGVPDASVREAIRNGISKVNIATELKMPMADAIKACFCAKPDESDPRKYMRAGKEAVQAMVEKKIQLCGFYEKK